MNNLNQTVAASQAGRSVRIKQHTTTAHDSLDALIMQQTPFASLAHYRQFLTLQYFLLQDAAVLYQHPSLQLLVADLAERSRFSLLQQDFADLGWPQPELYVAPALTLSASLPELLGWLYVIEGSKLGAAMLGRQLGQLALSAEFGGHYLAGPGAGRGAAWRELLQLFDQQQLTAAEEAVMFASARHAFVRVRQHLAWLLQHLALPEAMPKAMPAVAVQMQSSMAEA
jgi:heme oxygenase